jgi:hypothetical protein
VKGGEIATIKAVARAAGTDASTWDVRNDGYIGANRPVATTSLTAGDRPLFLVDDGLYGYGTLFGCVIGGIAGQLSYGVNSASATQLGPATAAGSGKLTLWDKPGTYAITLDAVDTTAGTGLMPTNPTLAIGAVLYPTSAGLVTPTKASAVDGYEGGSLVNTPVSLVTASYAPTPGSPAYGGMSRALIWFSPPTFTAANLFG